MIPRFVVALFWWCPPRSPFSDSFQRVDSTGAIKLGRKRPTALHLACEAGDTAAVRKLLSEGKYSNGQELDPNATTASLWTPLHVACCRNHADIAKVRHPPSSDGALHTLHA